VEQGGIDPSLYFEDGKAYFMSNGTDKDGRSGIFQCEIDISNGKKLSEAKCIWHGTGGRFLESPHIYKIKGKYYLMAAEGGTEYGHMIVYATGDSIYGPFVEAPHNPLLTNRNLGGHVIQGCGHGDLVEDTKGNIWMLHLGFRQIGEWVMHHITGREVYLVPVTMDESGYLSAGTDGTTRKTVTTPLIDTVQKPWEKYTFKNTKPCREWIFIQNPNFENYDFSEESLVLTSNSVSLSDSDGSPTFTAVRQKELNFSLSCEIQSEGCEAGISLYLTAEQHYDFGIRKSSDGNGYELFRRLKIGDITHEDNIIPLPENSAKATFEIDGSNFAYTFRGKCNGQSCEMGSAQTKYLSSEIAGNFTGVVIGLYAYNTPDEQPSKAVFTDLSVVNGDWVRD
jgi:alpha-N-arabinofuranosidase